MDTIAHSATQFSSDSYQTRKRFRVWERDNGICWLCNQWVDHRDSSLDHIEPLSRGGSNKMENLRITHRTCNSMKGSRSYEGFLKHKEKLREEYIARLRYQLKCLESRSMPKETLRTGTVFRRITPRVCLIYNSYRDTCILRCGKKIIHFPVFPLGWGIGV